MSKFTQALAILLMSFLLEIESQTTVPDSSTVPIISSVQTDSTIEPSTVPIVSTVQTDSTSQSTSHISVPTTSSTHVSTLVETTPGSAASTDTTASVTAVTTVDTASTTPFGTTVPMPPGVVAGFQASSWAPCYIDLQWSAPSSSLPVSQYVLSVYQNTTCVQQVIISGTPVSHFATAQPSITVTGAPSPVAANSTTTQPNIKSACSQLSVNATLGSSVNYRVSQLQKLTLYNFTLYAANDAGSGVAVSILANTSSDVPTAPVTNVTVTPRATNVDISWTAPTNDSTLLCNSAAYLYNMSVTFVNCTNNHMQTYNVAPPINGTNFTLPGLSPHWSYNVSILPVNHALESHAPFAVVVVTTLPTAPGLVDGVTVQSVTDRGAVVTWLSPTQCEDHSSVIGYNVTCCGTDLSYAQQATDCHNTTTPNNDTSWTVANILRPYSNYTCGVAAVTTEQGPFTWLVFQTLQDLPGPVENVTIAVTYSTIELAWTRPVLPNGQITAYNLKWTPVDGSVGFNATSTLDTTYNITGLLSYTTYNVSVSASTAAGQGSPLYFIVLTSIGPPLPLKSMKVTAVNSTSVLVQWTPGDRATAPSSDVSYIVTLTDATNPNVTFTHTLTGYASNMTVFTKLQEYWDYLATITSVAVDRNISKPYLTVSTPPVDVKTLQDVPGSVGSFSIGTSGTTCYLFTVTWTLPNLSERNGDIVAYMINSSSSNRAYEATSRTIDVTGSGNANLPSYTDTIQVLADGSTYMITIQAKSVVGYGPAATLYKKSLDTCVPEISTSEALQQVLGSGSSDSTVSEFSVNFNTSFVCNTTNGNITRRGVILFNAADYIANLSTIQLVTPLEMSQYVSWSVAQSATFHVPYRPTEDTWAPDCNQTSAELVVGSSPSCALNTYCNGPLSGDTQFYVTLFVCTKEQCEILALNKRNVFQTKAPAPSNSGAIVAAVLVPILVVLIIGAIVVLLVLKRMRKWPFSAYRKPMTPSGISNPAYDTPLDIVEADIIQRPSPIPLSEFDEVVRIKQKDSNLIFAEEYKLLKKLSASHSWTAGEQDVNRLKNRYTNIYPYDHSRVVLHHTDEDDGSDFINANYIPGYNSRREYIAAQGPLPGTIEDFWRMVWEQHVSIIVMLTKLEERGRSKCERYWPADNEAVFYGDLQVQLRSESNIDNYVIRMIDVKLGAAERAVKQFHFLVWPDFGCPENPEQLIEFVSDVRMHVPLPRFHVATKGPILVHCSAGVGRTGTFIAVDHLLQHMRQHDNIDVFGTVLEARDHRCHMVQSEDQYIYIHECLAHVIRQGLHNPQVSSDEIYVNGAIDVDVDDPVYENSIVT